MTAAAGPSHEGTPANGEWKEYKRLVMDSLNTLKADVKEIQNDTATIKTEIALLKLKSGLWGLTAGMVGSVAVILIRSVIR